MDKNLPSPKTTRKGTQIGRGMGSGRGGHYAGRGGKGQSARSGFVKPRKNFEGGQSPLSKRLPKLKNVSGSNTRTRLFKIRKIKNNPVKLSKIIAKVKANDVVDIKKLEELNIIKQLNHKSLEVKVLFDQEIDKAITFKGVKLSKSAIAAVEKAGGKVE